MQTRRVLGAALVAAASSLIFASGSRCIAAESAARQDFDKAYDQYKDVVKQLTDLQNRYPSATPEERPAMEQKFTDLVKEGNRLRPKMMALAEKAYVETPTDTALADMMYSVVATLLRSDDYEEAFRLAKLLIGNKYPQPQIYNMAGAAAFFLSNYDAAEKYLKQAGDNNTLDEKGKQVLESIKDYRDKWAREQKFRDAEGKADDLPRVKLTIGDFKGNVKGDIVVELFENQAPNTVANFINLVEKKTYDGLTFHRVLSGFMAQGGDPDGNGTGGPGYHVADECNQPNHREHFRGSLSMAHSAAPDSNGSQFFINFVPTAHLDGKHTVFGRVIEGFDVLAKIQRINPDEPAPGVLPDKIIKAVVLRKREHAYEPKKLP
ncbi:MAG TPA: peptidylprolyl isomerase [Pirellulales bacterium]|jgi:cyclophilin family peptidyl-prolyl cis-trans isomerase|nr:peptidylprolyl isomerase [Pirellulales bacterium]